MNKIHSTKSLKGFWADDQGVTAVEYGILSTAISLVVLTGVNTFNAAIMIKYNQIITFLNGP